MKTKSNSRIWIHIILAAFLLILWNGVLEARLVAYSEARLAAARLVEMENGRPDLRLTKETFWLDGVEHLIHKNQQVAYLVKLKPQGFMILSDVTEVSPQVFVSFSGDFEILRKHPFLMRILDHLEYDKIHLLYLDWGAYSSGYLWPEEGPDLIQIERNEHAWSALLSDSAPDMLRAMEFSFAKAVEPMLISTWNQDSPYWNYTPRIGGQATLTGCSATAMAQVMYFWKYPERGQGSHSYVWNNETLYADFNHPYLWDSMRSSYSYGYTNGQADAVARLMSDVGIAIDMNYGLGASSAVPNKNNAFVSFFKYSQDVHYIYRSNVVSWDAWFDILKQQMDIHQPAILAVNKPDVGHAIVADGYRTSPSNQIHVNMGWGGSNDNYYTVSNIYGYGDANRDYAVIDIRPTQLMTLNISASLGGTTKPAPGTYAYNRGTQVQVTAIPDTDYNFVNWSGDISSSQNPVTVTMDGDMTIKAKFRLMAKLTIRSDTDGTTNPVPGVYAYPRNVVVQVTAIPAWYSFFINWTGDETGTANPVSVKMNRDKSIRANFRYIFAPTASGVKVLNRSYSQVEYINILSWQANPANAGLDIPKYRIYLMNNGTFSFLAEVGADQRQYSHRKAGQEKLVYAIVAVHSSGREGAPALVTVQ